VLLPCVSSSLAPRGEAECSTPDSGGSVGAARAAVPTPAAAVAVLVARGFGVPAAARARPGSQVGVRRAAAAGEREGGEREEGARPAALASRPGARGRGRAGASAPGATAKCSSGKSRRFRGEVGARKSGAQPGRPGLGGCVTPARGLGRSRDAASASASLPGPRATGTSHFSFSPALGREPGPPRSHRAPRFRPRPGRPPFPPAEARGPAPGPPPRLACA
jgi:hypothetical protein